MVGGNGLAATSRRRRAPFHQRRSLNSARQYPDLQDAVRSLPLQWDKRQGHRQVDSVSFCTVLFHTASGFLITSLGCFRLVFAHGTTTTLPTRPLVSALRLVCCLRIQIWLSLSLCYACSHRVFTLGAPCMGLLGPCRLKSFLRQSIYYHTL